MILSLSIISIIVLISTPLFNTIISLQKSNEDIYLMQDEIGIYQLQLLLARNNITNISADEIEYSSSESECVISLVNNNLISQPGYLCYLLDVDDVYFYKKFFIVYIEFTRKGEMFTYPIAYEY